MMNLDIQIKTLLFSFAYGIFFGLLVVIFNRLLYHKNAVIKIACTFVMTIGLAIIYFILLKKLNEAIIHPYFLLMFILGFSLESYLRRIIKYIAKKIKR